MNENIKSLKSTTFANRRFTRKQVFGIQQIVQEFPNLSLRELGHTVCEYLKWVTPGGNDRIQTCLNALEQMQAVGLFVLPKKMKRPKTTQKKVEWSSCTDEQSEITGSLSQFSAISLQKVNDKAATKLWNEFIDRHHYLGYRKPIGTHIRYFIVARSAAKKEQILGCLIFSFPTLSLSCRDNWVGWDKKARNKRLDLILNNNRFLIFPWVKVKNLASKVLSLATRQVADDWMDQHGFRPVLLETFVDPDKHLGTCYKAANWQLIGKTQGQKGSPNVAAISPKNVYVYPLTSNYQSALIEGNKPIKDKKSSHIPEPSALEADDPFVCLWQRIIHILSHVADDFDKQWQQRKRTINTMLLILFIFRLVFSQNKQGYGITIVELWDQCRVMNIPLPQQKPAAPSAFSTARMKLDEDIFKVLNNKIIHTYKQNLGEQCWKGHSVFAVDGSKITLPRQLRNRPYKTPSDNAYYPQGLVSCLYQLKSKIPYDFDLVAHHNERAMALSHLKCLNKQDLVVYDRGYFSYAMLYYHLKAGVQAVFRLKQNSGKVIDEFFASDETDTVVIVEIQSNRYNEIRSRYPNIIFRPIKMRLVKYSYDDTIYVLGTTLLDSQYYKKEELSDLYHSRWGIEELYKISKVLINVEEFHAQSERGIKQELFAHFVLITLHRIFANHAEDEINEKDKTNEDGHILGGIPMFRINAKNSLRTMARNLESMFLQHAELLAKTLNNMVDAISFCKQKERPGRKYNRISRKPTNKWRSSNSKKIAETS